MKEQWKPVHVPAFASTYSVSTLGRVRRDIGGRGAVAGYILTPKPVRKYHQVLLRNGRGVHAYKYVHHLVLFAFRGVPPGPLGCKRGQWQCDHDDRDTHNNALSNLHWLLSESNQARSRVSKGAAWFTPKRLAQIERDGMRTMAKISPQDAREIAMSLRDDPARENIVRLSGKYGIDLPAVRSILRRKSWKIVTRDIWATCSVGTE